MHKNSNKKNPEIGVEPYIRNMRPDFTINFEDGSRCLVELKIVDADSNSAISKSETYILNIFASLFLDYFKNSNCHFRCIDILDNKNKQSTGTLVGYFRSNNTAFFTGYESIVCKECLENPLSKIDGYVLFEKFKLYKKEQKSEIWDNKYKRQVRSAVERVNKRLKSVFNLDDDVLIYSEIPIVTINKKFLF